MDRENTKSQCVQPGARPGTGLKILQIVHQFPPAVTGGSMNYTLELSKALNEKHRISLLFARRDLTREQYEVQYGEYQGLPYTQIIHNGIAETFDKTYRDERIDAIFERVLDRDRPDIVHIQHLMFLSANIVRIAKERQLPIVFTLHDFWLMCPRQIRMKPSSSLCFDLDEDECNACILAPPMMTSLLDQRTMDAVRRIANATSPRIIDALKRVRASTPEILLDSARRLRDIRAWNREADATPLTSRAIQDRNQFLDEICSRVDLFVAPSHWIRDEFIRHGIPAEKILHSPHGHVHDWKPRRRVRAGKLRFGYAGVVEEHKGVAVLVEAFNRIAPEDAVLNIFGGHNVHLDYVKKLERSITNPAIRMLGRFDHDRLGEVYEEIDVMVMPSLCFENAPLTICEAFMAGVPVVASKLGGMAELVRHGENGLLFQAGNADDLYRQLTSLIKDPSLADRLALGIPTIKPIEHDANDFAQRYEALLARV